MISYAFIFAAVILNFVQALTITSTTLNNGVLTVTWTFLPTDPSVFTIELTQSDGLIDKYAIANNVPSNQGTISVTLPPVPAGSGYNVEFVNVGDINQVYTTSGDFTVTEIPETTIASVSSAPVTSGIVTTRPATLTNRSVFSTTTIATGTLPSTTVVSTSTVTVVSTVTSITAATLSGTVVAATTPRPVVSPTTTASSSGAVLSVEVASTKSVILLLSFLALVFYV